MARQIVLDTETTGLDAASGDRIVEIGYVRLSENSAAIRPSFQCFNFIFYSLCLVVI